MMVDLHFQRGGFMGDILASVVIPIFKNEMNISDLSERLDSLEHSLAINGINLEIVFVIDGSPDKSYDFLLKRKNLLNKVNWQIISLSRNFGQGNAILAGFSISRGDAHICMSADLQDPPELILELLKSYKSGNDIVVAVRTGRDDSIVARVTSFTAYYFLRRQVPNIPRGGFDFFLISDLARVNLLKLRGAKRFLQGDVMSLGFKTAFIPYVRKSRIQGKSAYNFKSRLTLFLDFLIDVSTKPLRIITSLGVLVSLIGFISAIGTLWLYLNNLQAFQGFTPIYLGILIFGGLQIISIGILGEYVMRIYDMQRNRHEWIIEKID